MIVRQVVHYFTRYRVALRMAFLAGAFGLAFAAHRAFEAKDGKWGAVYLGIASLFILFAIPTSPIQLPNLSQAYPQLASGKRRCIGLLFLGLSGACLAGAFLAFYRLAPDEIPSSRPWDAFLIGIGMLAVGIGLFLRGTGASPSLSRRYTWVLAGIITLALFLRLYLAEQVPFGLWYDEAVNGLEAQRMLHDTDYRPFFVINMTQVHLWLYQVALRLWGETSSEALRMTSVFFGVGTVIAGYQVGKLLRGPNFGLMMAFLLAVMRWSINFSRVAMTGIDTVFFTLVAFYFMVRVLRYGRWRDAAWLGLALGMGLWFYSAFRFMGVALGLYALIQGQFWRGRILKLGILAAGVMVVAFLPMLIFIQRQPEAYFARSEQVSVFDAQNRRIADLGEALEHSFRRHLGMFHLQGDANGRHNLPDAPMLDPIMGVLMAFGLALAIRNFKQAEEWFFIFVLILGLVPGLVSYEFEAPQALRSIGVITAVAYFSALALFSISQFLGRYSWAKTGVGLGVVGLCGVILFYNYDVYFNKQQYAYDTWKAFSTVSSVVGEQAKSRPNNTQIYFSPLVSFDNNIHFNYPELISRAHLLDLPDIFPIRQAANSPVVVFLDVVDTWMLTLAQKIYPHARYQTVYSSDYGVREAIPLLYMIDLSPDDLAAVQGLDENGIGVLYAPRYGDYRLSAPRGVRLFVDNQEVSSPEIVLVLAQGNHAIRLEPPEVVGLEWRRSGDFIFSPIPDYYLYHEPVEVMGFWAKFYNNANWEDLPVLQRIDPALDMYFHEIPLERPYSVSWSGWLSIETAGVYGFSLNAVEYAEFSINGTLQLISSAPHENAVSYVELKNGSYFIEVRYQDTTSFSRIHLRWQAPEQDGFVTIPPESIRPQPYLIP